MIPRITCSGDNHRRFFSLAPTGILFLLIISVNYGCQNNQKDPSTKEEPKTEVATFGAGCYWCSEAIFQRVKGVSKVTPGFMGQDDNATYADVVDEKTEFAEICQIEFDPESVSYTQLLEIFFQVHDPTSINKQGEDTGPLYRSVIFFHNKSQHKIARRTLDSLNLSKVFDKEIVTNLEPAGKLIQAKEKEFNYFNKNRENKHCQMVILPKIEKFQQAFQELYDESVRSK